MDAGHVAQVTIAFEDGTVARFDGDAADEEMDEMEEGGVSITPLDPVDDLFIDEDGYHLHLGEPLPSPVIMLEFGLWLQLGVW